MNAQGGISAVIALMTVFLTGCGSAGMEAPLLPAAPQRLALDGFSFASPAEPGWHIVQQTPYRLVLIKEGDTPDETFAIEAQLFKAPHPVAGKDFVQQVKEAEDQDAPAPRFSMQIHEVMPVKVGEATCARSHSVALDNSPHTKSGSGKPMLLELVSLNCLHPQDTRVGFNIGYSLRYPPRQGDAGFEAKATALLSTAELGQLDER